MEPILSIDEIAEKHYPTKKWHYATSDREITDNKLAHIPFKKGFNSRNEEVQQLIDIIRDIYVREEAITIQYAQNGWTYQRPQWFFTVKELLKKYNQQ